ncbi:hypothetical protein HN937_20170 [Candidatus Poribacteria bacterium]|jgi:hypothetical protein|nr:hypothetical protein [Candidatus Poribacteria bacterium]
MNRTTIAILLAAALAMATACEADSRQPEDEARRDRLELAADCRSAGDPSDECLDLRCTHDVDCERDETCPEQAAASGLRFCERIWCVRHATDDTQPGLCWPHPAGEVECVEDADCAR